MDATGEDEPDPIKLKSIKGNKTFTVPQNDRVRELAACGDNLTPNSVQGSAGLMISCLSATIHHSEHKLTLITNLDGLVRNSAYI